MNITHKLADKAILAFQKWAKVLPSVRDFTEVESKSPIAAITKDGVVTKDGNVSRIIRLEGKDTTGLTTEALHELFEYRQTFFRELSPNVTAFLQSHRHLEPTAIPVTKFPIRVAEQINTTWRQQFTQGFRTYHYLLLSTALDSTDLFKLLEKAKRAVDSSFAHLQDLDQAVQDALSRLQEYHPVEIHGEEAASYLAFLLNGRKVSQKLPHNGYLDGFLSDTRLHWPSGRAYQIYDGPVRRYSGWLTVKVPATETTYSLLDALFSIQGEISLYQTFSALDHDLVIKRIEDQLRNIQLWKRHSEHLQDELEQLLSRVQGGEISMLNHRFSIEIFGNSIEELDKSVLEVRTVIEKEGFRVMRETINCEAQFWSRFPSMATYNPRVRQVSSESASHFSTMPKIGEGSRSCSWGNAPVTTFKTPSGSDYSFIFHESTARFALGHTLIVGRSGRGKTVLFEFLNSQCYRYPDFRTICLDSKEGMRPYTHSHGGRYISTTDIFDMGINPFSLPNIPDSHLFLTKWLEDLLKPQTQADKDAIALALKELYELPPDRRELANLATSLKRSNLESVLTKWLPEGTFGSYFNGVTDTLSFHDRLITFDMAAMLDKPDVLGPMASYLFYRIQHHEFPSGFLVFVDEAPMYFRSSLTKYFEEMLLQLRKRDGIIVFASQTADAIYNSPIAEAVSKNIATFILFPDPYATYEQYQSCFGLNEAEFAWIKQPHQRQVMVKRNNGESAILNVDLSCLGSDLKYFSTSIEDIKRAREMVQEHGESWMRYY